MELASEKGKRPGWQLKFFGEINIFRGGDGAEAEIYLFGVGV